MPADNASHRVLLIDVGNTNLKWAWLDGTELSSISAEPHTDKGADELVAITGAARQAPAAMFLANVGRPDLDQGLVDAFNAVVPGVAVERVTSQAEQLGVTSGYRQPSQLGVDRWLTLLAVRANHAEAVCIVDCGTALTIDLLDGVGRHHGGLILPGLDLMRDALLARTHIPRVDAVSDELFFGVDTAQAVASAALHSAAALIERSMQRARELLATDVTLVVTGSDAKTIAAATGLPCLMEPRLVMQGLALYAQEQMRG